MSTLLQESDFRGEINIPGTERQEVCEELCRFIKQYEPIFMRDALGVGFSSEVYLQAALSTGRPAQYDLLITGGSWTDTNISIAYGRYFEGLKYCAARFVYLFWLKDQAILNAPVGNVKSTGENSSALDPRNRQASAWNEMVHALRELWDFVQRYEIAGTLAFDTANMDSPQYWKFDVINSFGI